MPKRAQTWLVKSEPSAYSWEQFLKDRRTAWTGVRNFQARNHLRAMKNGDPVFFYHSVVGKEIVGLAQVAAPAYPDPTASDGDWSCVDLTPLSALPKPIGLDEIKATPSLAQMGLLRQSRLSVMPVTPQEFATLLALAGTTERSLKAGAQP